MDEGTYMTPLVEILNTLRERGYVNDFELMQGGMLSKQTNEIFQPDDLVIESVYRFEGNSNPDDMAVMYAVKAVTGTKGIIIDAYGTYEDNTLGDFLRNVKIVG